MCVFLLFLFGKRTNKKSVQKFNQGCLLFSKEEEDHFFESFLDPQISFARIL